MVGARLWRGVGLGLGIVFLLGCSLFSGTPPAAEVPVVTVAVTDAPTVAPPTTQPAASPTPQMCPDPSNVAPPQRLSDDLEGTESFIAAVQDYLTQGGDAERVPLAEQEALRQADLTGDGGLETVYVMMAASPDQVFGEGLLIVFSCRAGEVIPLYRYAAGESNGLELIALEDLTQDEVADLVFSQYTCGAHTCWHTPNVWSWAGRDFADRMGSAFQYPYPTYTLEAGSLVVVSAGQGSVGAGPQRLTTTTLGWSGTAITVTDESVAPPTYRYHAFLDGDRALSAGDLASAEAAYRSVIENDALESWGGFGDLEDERLWLEALGWWRLMILDASVGRADDMETAYAMIAGLDSPAPGYPVRALAERFQRSFQRDGDLPAACAYAVDTTGSEQVLGFLNGFGYANPYYEVPDLCPSYAYPYE